MSERAALVSLLDAIIAMSPSQSTVAKVRNYLDLEAQRARALIVEEPEPLLGVNLVPLAIEIPPGVRSGESVRASVLIANQGDTPTPPDTVVDVLLGLDGRSVAWSDNITVPLAPGESRLQVMNGGPNGTDGTFTMTQGTHLLDVIVNSGAATRPPIDEFRFDNNRLAVEVAVGAAPVVTPPPPTPPHPPGGRQPLMVWLGWGDSNALSDHQGMPRLNEAGLGAMLSLASLNEVVPDWLAGIIRSNTHARGASMYLAKLMHNPELLRISAVNLLASVRKIEGTMAGVDMEPYPDPGVNHTMWSNGEITRAQAKEAGRVLGGVWAELDNIIVYTSSMAGFEGSYNDLAHQAAGNTPPGTSFYANNVMPDLMDGMIAEGARFTYTDASFHYGPQLRDGWEAGTARCVDLFTRRWPSQGASTMTWPDIDEGSHGDYSAAEMRVAWEAATRISSGPATLYQHTIGAAVNSPQWQEWLHAAALALA